MLERAGVAAADRLGTSSARRRSSSPCGEGTTRRCGASSARYRGGSGWRWCASAGGKLVDDAGEGHARGRGRSASARLSGRRWCIATASCDRRSGATTTPGKWRCKISWPGARRCFGRPPHFCATSKRTRGSRSARRRYPETSDARCRPVGTFFVLLRSAGAPRRRPPGSSAVDGGVEANDRMGHEHRVHAGDARRGRRSHQVRILRGPPQRSRGARSARLGRALALVARAVSRAARDRRSAPGRCGARLAATPRDALAQARREEP